MTARNGRQRLHNAKGNGTKHKILKRWFCPFTDIKILFQYLCAFECMLEGKNYSRMNNSRKSSLREPTCVCTCIVSFVVFFFISYCIDPFFSSRILVRILYYTIDHWCYYIKSFPKISDDFIHIPKTELKSTELLVWWCWCWWSETNPKQLYTSRLAVWFIVSIVTRTKQSEKFLLKQTRIIEVEKERNIVQSICRFFLLWAFIAKWNQRISLLFRQMHMLRAIKDNIPTECYRSHAFKIYCLQLKIGSIENLAATQSNMLRTRKVGSNVE